MNLCSSSLTGKCNIIAMSLESGHDCGLMTFKIGALLQTPFSAHSKLYLLKKNMVAMSNAWGNNGWTDSFRK